MPVLDLAVLGARRRVLLRIILGSSKKATEAYCAYVYSMAYQVKYFADHTSGILMTASLLGLAPIVALLLLLLPCRSEAQTDQSSVDTLVAILRERANTITLSVDHEMEELSKGSKEEQSAVNQLKTLRERFLSLFDKHIAAIKSRNFLLTHELQSSIDDIMSQIKATIRRAVSAEEAEIYGSVPNVAPKAGIDEKYRAAAAMVYTLSKSTDAMLKSLKYPGSPPTGITADLSDDVFGSPKSNVDKQ